MRNGKPDRLDVLVSAGRMLVMLLLLGAVGGCQTQPPTDGSRAEVGTHLSATTSATTPVHDPEAGINARRTKTQEETARLQSYTLDQGQVLKWVQGTASPVSVRSGERVELTAEYALLGSGGGVQVTETRGLYRGEQLVRPLGVAVFTRSDGTWASTVNLRLADGLAAGEYTVRTEVSTIKTHVLGSVALSVN